MSPHSDDSSLARHSVGVGGRREEESFIRSGGKPTTFSLTLKSVSNQTMAPPIRIRIRAIARYPPHFENSYYGPLDKFLNLIFSGPHFIIKPQALLRMEEETKSTPAPINLDIEAANDEYHDGELDYVVDDGHNDEGSDDDSDDENPLADTSVDSYNIAVGHRGTNRFPDFVTCFFEGDIGSDVIRLVIEVKAHDYTLTTAVEQLEDYLELAGPRSQNERLHGVLIVKDVTWKLGGTRFAAWLECIAKEDLENENFVRWNWVSKRWDNVSW
ncbi:hypothetical protein AB1N83_010200 [Pleurotus pulmonarius]